MAESGMRHVGLPPSSETGGETRLPGARYALVIGIDSYKPPHQVLSYAVNDAKAIRHRLENEFGFRVTPLIDSDATAKNIRNTLAQWTEEAKPEDSVLVFFAGHGANHPSEERKNEGYLLPIEASEDPSSWLPHPEIVEYAKQMPARRVFLIFDACHAGNTFRFREEILPGERDDQVLKALAAGTGAQPVLDGGAGDHSVFTRAVLDSLDGWAQSGRLPDDIISADELIVWVRSEVPGRSRMRGHEQTPVGGALQGCSTGEDFEFKPIKPRLPAPLLRNIYSPNAEDRVAAAQQLGARAPTDVIEVTKLKVDELERLVKHDTTADVRVTAARALGILGHPGGFDPLASLLRSDTESREVRAAAALALGNLAQTVIDIDSRDLATGRRDAVQTLIDMLDSPDAAVLEAAKLGLGQVVASGGQLAASLKDRCQTGRKQHILDALACLANNYPDDDQAWPALSAIHSQLLRRLYLARRRFRPQWPDILRQALIVGLSGAIGLSLAYFVVILRVHWNEIKTFGPAELSYNLLPGTLAGVGLAFLPRLARAMARRQGIDAASLGGIAGGLCLGVGMALPNWFLGVGEGVLALLLPGLVSGPILGLMLVRVPDKPTSITKQTLRAPAQLVSMLSWRFVAVAVAGALSFAAMRIPEWLSFGNLKPHYVEVGLWAAGGAILGTVLAIGWSISPTGKSQPVTVSEDLTQMSSRG